MSVNAQSCNNQNRMERVQKGTQKREPTNKPRLVWSVKLQQRMQEYTVWKQLPPQ